MKLAVCLLFACTVASAQYYGQRQPYGGSSGIGGRPSHGGIGGRPSHGSGVSIGGGAPIRFPANNRPQVQPRPPVHPVHPVAPVSPGRPIAPVQSGGVLSPIGANEPSITYFQACGSKGSSGVDYSDGTYDYHYSWCNDGGRKYDWQTANNYCSQLGGGWRGVSIQDAAKNNFVVSVVETHRLPYIWTSGKRDDHNIRAQFYWTGINSPVSYTYWSQTGGQGLPQPDNHEGGNEPCLGILNHFYPGDTTTWHDIQCYHTKPIICERPSAGHIGGGQIGGGQIGGGHIGGGQIGGGHIGGGNIGHAGQIGAGQIGSTRPVNRPSRPGRPGGGYGG